MPALKVELIIIARGSSAHDALTIVGQLRHCAAAAATAKVTGQRRRRRVARQRRAVLDEALLEGVRQLAGHHDDAA